MIYLVQTIMMTKTKSFISVVGYLPAKCKHMDWVIGIEMEKCNTQEHINLKHTGSYSGFITKS